MKRKLTILTCFIALCSFAFGQELHWTPNVHTYNGSMSIEAVIYIDGDEQKTTSLEVGAFVGSEVRGSTMLKHVSFPNAGIDSYRAQLLIYGEDPAPITFKLFDHESDSELNVECTTTVTFKDDDVLGNLFNPYQINFSSPVVNVAKIGDVEYTSLQEAVSAAEDGATIELLSNINEAVNIISLGKTITIDGKSYDMTAGLSFGSDNNNLDNGIVTIKNIDFVGTGVSVKELKKVTIQNNTFTNITANNGITVICDNLTEEVNVSENIVSNVDNGAGIRIRNPKALNITNNNVEETSHNAITIEGTTYGDAVITGNVLKNWGKGADNGRAIRMVKGANTTATITNNAMLHNNAPEEFVKITGNTENVSIDKNYWNGANPVGEHTPAYYLVEDITPNSYYQNYSVENGLEDLLPTQASVAQIGDYYYPTLAAAVEAVETGETILMIDNAELSTTITIPVEKTVILNLNGKKIAYTSTTQNEAMITNRGNLTINDGDSKDEMGEIYYNYTGAADPSYGKGNYTISNGGTLTVNGGKIHIAKLSQHAKYPIDNNSTSGDAILVINGGHLYNYNTSAIRQFCNSTTNKNSVTINGGLIEGYSAVWMQNPGSKEVNGQLAINAGEIRTTAKAYVEGTSSISEVASKIYCTTEGGTWDEESAFVITGGTINENVYLGEESPASMTLYKEAQFNGYVEFDLSEGRELVHNGLSNVTVTKNITGHPVPENNSEYVDGWYTISSPVGTVNHTDVVGLLNGTHDLYYYNEKDMMWENVKDTQDNTYTRLENGQGYLYANTVDTELLFKGSLNTAAVTYSISYTEENSLAGFNLIGNPFTYNITKSNMSGANLAVGFYTLSNHGAWQPKAEDATIAPMQGALIKATEKTDNFIIAPNSAKRSGSENNGQIKIEVSNVNYNDVAYVSFNEGIGLDKIEHRNANIPMVYVPVDGINYAIATMSQDVTEIPVSFRAMTMGQYTIGAEAQDCEYAMMTLVDRLTGTETNLLLEDYTFVATTKDNADRFIIKLAKINADGENEDNFAFINNGIMYIYNIEGQGMVSIYDVTGRPVAEFNVETSANIPTSELTTGIYIIRMTDNNGVKVQKILID